jgi:hypothetical protein
MSHEFQHGLNLLSCDAELLHQLVNAHILQILEYSGDRRPCVLDTHAPLRLPGMLSTAGHCDQSSVAMV